MMVASKMVVLFASLASMAAFLQGCGKDDEDKSTFITTTAAATTQPHDVPAMCLVKHEQFDCHFIGTSKNKPADSEEECCQRCHDDNSCFAWVFYKDLETTDPMYHLCSLKPSECQLRANFRLVAGFKGDSNATTTTAAANVTTTSTAAANATTTTSTAAANATTTITTTTHEATVNTTITTTETFNTSTTTLTGNTTAVSSSTTTLTGNATALSTTTSITGNTTALSTTTAIVTSNATATSTTTVTAAPTTAHATHTTTSKGEDAQQVEVIAI